MAAKGGLGKVLKQAKTAEDSDSIIEEIEKDKGKTETKEKTNDQIINKKQIIIAISVIIILFGLFVFIASFQNKITPKSIDDYHLLNLEGKESKINYMYNGFSFVKAEGLWHTQIAEYEQNKMYDLALRYSPKEVLNVSVTGKGLNQNIKNVSTLYISHNPESTHLNYVALSAAEMTLSIVGVQHLQVIAACTKNMSGGCEGVPIVTCEDTDKFVLEIVEKGNAEVVFDNNCIKIKGNEEELMRAADRLIFEWLGIIRE